MKKLLFLFLFCTAFLSIAPHVYADAASAQGKVLSVQVIKNEQDFKERKIQVKVLTGPLKGHVYTTDDFTNTQSTYYSYHPGDIVLVAYTTNGSSVSLYITDFDRRLPIMILLAIFVILIVLICQKQGLTALIGMIVSLFIITHFVIPAILQGIDPFFAAMLSAIPIIPLTYMLAHGVNRKTIVAIFASFITLGCIAGLASFFSYLSRLSNIISPEEVGYFQSKVGPIDLHSLYLAGIMIGAIAVLNDITISQSSVVTSLYNANKTLSINELFTHAMAVGKDHIASLVNTLVLVYVGSSLPLFLLFFNPNNFFLFDVNNQLIAIEVVRTIVVSIGIVAAVPITTYFAALVVKSKFTNMQKQVKIKEAT